MPESGTQPPEGHPFGEATGCDADRRDADRKGGYGSGAGLAAFVGPALFTAGMLTIALAGAGNPTMDGLLTGPMTDLRPTASPSNAAPAPGGLPAGHHRATDRLEGGSRGEQPKTETKQGAGAEAETATKAAGRTVAKVSVARGAALDRCVRIRRLAETSCRKQIFPDQEAPMSECVKRELRYTLWSIYGCQ